jgi:hypothetical protein
VSHGYQVVDLESGEAVGLYESGASDCTWSMAVRHLPDRWGCQLCILPIAALGPHRVAWCCIQKVCTASGAKPTP